MPRRKIGKISLERLIVSFAFATGVTLIFLGVLWSRTGRESLDYPDAIESTSPAPGDRQVLRETAIEVQLKGGYSARLTIDGVSLDTINLDDYLQQQGAPRPGEQIDLPAAAIYDPGNARITFQPSDDAQITEFSTGIHTATVTYWKTIEGERNADSFSWTFEVL